MTNETKKKIRKILLENGSITKPELAKATNLTVATCGYILNGLVENGEVIAENFRTSNGGRPAMSYRYNSERYRFLCMYALFEGGAETIHYRITDAMNGLHGKGKFKGKNIEMRSILQCVQKILNKNPEICLISIGIQGGVCQGSVEFSDFPDLNGINLSREIEEKTGIPTVIENDMNAIAIGYSQKNSNEKNVAILFTPKGNPPAGGFLVDGNILRGNANFAGELSYFPFPFARNQQIKIFDNAKSALPYIQQILFATAVFLDPAVIVFTGGLAEDLSHANLDVQMQNHLHRPQLPRLLFITDSSDEYFLGLTKIATDYFLQNA